jgi:hypothetical protein
MRAATFRGARDYGAQGRLTRNIKRAPDAETEKLRARQMPPVLAQRPFVDQRGIIRNETTHAATVEFFIIERGPQRLTPRAGCVAKR